MMTITIGRVDMDGFCGRDFHPTKSDEGKTFTVLCVETYVADQENAGPMGADDFTADHGIALSKIAADTYNLFHCVDAACTKRTFVEYEVKSVQFS